MDKKYIIFTLVIVFALIIVGYAIYNKFIYTDNVKKLNKKVSKLQDVLLKDKELNFGQKEFFVFISVTDTDKKAYVTNSKGSTLNDAIEIARSKMEKKVKEYKINPEWVKIDVVNEKNVITHAELKEELDVKENYYRKGISLDENFDIALLESEINANEIINYESKVITYEKLNKYLNSEFKYGKKVNNLPNEIITFSTIGYIYDSKEISKLNTEENIGRRNISRMDELELLEIMEGASEYLIDNVKEDGKFIYRYNPIYNTESNSYNILRHEGTTWSMIEVYGLTKNINLKENIELAIKFVVNNCVKYKDDNTAYIKEYNTNEIKLGANGIGILMFIDYMETFKTDEYKELVLKLGNGISEMQNENGSYYHVYEYPEFSKYEAYRTVYYDGEATFALAKLYKYTKDEKYLRMAEKALDYFYKNNYEKYRDHWIEYSVNEVTKYTPKKEYFELGLKNVRDNLAKIVKKETPNPTNLELLTMGLEIYDRAKENGVTLEGLEIDDLVSAIYDRADVQLNGLFYPEYAMYFKNPKRIVNSFFIRDEKFRIRIDDVQHNINGYYNMYTLYKLLEKYS